MHFNELENVNIHTFTPLHVMQLMSSHTKYTAPGSVVNLAAEVVELHTVSVTWIPSIPRPNGFQVLVPTAGITENVKTASFKTILPRGKHSIQVRAMSQHYYSDPVSTNVTVRGERRNWHTSPINSRGPLSCYVVEGGR